MVRTKQTAHKTPSGAVPAGWGPKGVVAHSRDTVEKKIKKEKTRPVTAQKKPRSSLSAKTPRKSLPSASSGANKSSAGIKRRRRFRPGTVALRDIRKLQQTTNLLIPRAAFGRLAREVCMGFSDSYRWRIDALAALQEASEAYLTGIFEDAMLCCVHARRVTVMLPDIRLARRLRGENFV